jgi:PncC family amidohydrolase
MPETNDSIIDTIQKVHSLFKERRLTLSVAESCTGGLICHHITSLPGASAFFEAGIVTYSVFSKKNILGISPEAIQMYGVISEETAMEMARQARAITKTDYSVSSTGNLGPDTLECKEKGLVYIAVSSENKTLAKELRLTGDREDNKKKASFLALELLIASIEQ